MERIIQKLLRWNAYLLTVIWFLQIGFIIAHNNIIPPEEVPDSDGDGEISAATPEDLSELERLQSKNVDNGLIYIGLSLIYFFSINRYFHGGRIRSSCS